MAKDIANKETVNYINNNIDSIDYAYQPTKLQRKKCRDLYFCGIPPERIAQRFNITVPTLRYHFYRDMDDAKEEKITKISNLIYQDAENSKCKFSRDMIMRCIGKWFNAKPAEEKEREAKMISVLEKLVDKL